jgi:hypothetical protein
MALDQTKQVNEHLDCIQPAKQEEENVSHDIFVQVATTTVTDGKSSKPDVEEAIQGGPSGLGYSSE